MLTPIGFLSIDDPSCVSVKGDKLMIVGWSWFNKKTVKKKVVVRSYFEKKNAKIAKYW